VRMRAAVSSRGSIIGVSLPREIREIRGQFAYFPDGFFS